MKFSIVFYSGDERFVEYYKQAFVFIVNPGTGRRISLILDEIGQHIRFNAPDGRAVFNIVFDTDGHSITECHASISPAFAGQTAIVFSPSRTMDSLVGEANRKLRDCMILCCEHGDNKWPMRWPHDEEDIDDQWEVFEQKKTCAHRAKRIPLNPIYSAPLPLP